LVGKATSNGFAKATRQEVADHADQKHQVLLAEILRDAFEGRGGEAKAANVIRREIHRAGLGRQELERRDLVVVLQETVQGVSVEIFRAGSDGVALLLGETGHLDQLGHNLGLDFSERHGE